MTCLYLTPVFLAPSSHKYDTADYHRIDPSFGDEKTARRLVAECHARGMRVIFDGVFNHCGWGFAPFQDVVRRGARSRYAAWFSVESFPVRRQPRPNYETFGDRLAREAEALAGRRLARPEGVLRLPAFGAYLADLGQETAQGFGTFSPAQTFEV